MDKERDSDGYRHLGDIVICSAKLKYEAKFQKKNNNEILRDWLKHGLENLMKG
jgi:ssRNA-specific RNase YbeY (16S rRNA maturation enzyme)